MNNNNSDKNDISAVSPSNNSTSATAAENQSSSNVGEKKEGEKKSKKSEKANGVMMTMEDLKAWDVKIKDLQKGKKLLEKENKVLKLEKEELTKQLSLPE